MFLAFKNGVKSIQTAGYNGARTVVENDHDFRCTGRLSHEITHVRKVRSSRIKVQSSCIIDFNLVNEL